MFTQPYQTLPNSAQPYTPLQMLTKLSTSLTVYNTFYNTCLHTVKLLRNCSTLYTKIYTTIPNYTRLHTTIHNNKNLRNLYTIVVQLNNKNKLRFNVLQNCTTLLPDFTMFYTYLQTFSLFF